MNILLSFLLFSPLVGALLVFLFGKDERLAKWIAFGVSLVPLLLSVLALAQFDWTNSGLQFTELTPWIHDFGVSYYLAVDGLSMPLVVLTTLLTTLTTLFSFDVAHRTKTYFTLLMLLETGILGVFISLDFFLFYLFWELVLIPMYFLIVEWGGPRRRYAALKFFVYTHVASLVMLVGIVAIYFVAGRELGYYTFNMIEITQKVHFAAAFQYLVFPALFFGFAVKIPVVPFHTWLPDAHVEAPTGGSVLLAGVLLKMGGYGLIRIAFCLMPDAARHYMLPMAVLGAISMLYGAFLALAQDDMKKNGGLFLREPHGFGAVGVGGHERQRLQRGHLSNVRPRDHFGDALYALRYFAAYLPYAKNLRTGRFGQPFAEAGRFLCFRLFRFPGAAPFGRFRRRIARFFGRFRGLSGAYRRGHDFAYHYRRLLFMGPAAGHVRPLPRIAGNSSSA